MSDALSQYEQASPFLLEETLLIQSNLLLRLPLSEGVLLLAFKMQYEERDTTHLMMERGGHEGNHRRFSLPAQEEPGLACYQASRPAIAPQNIGGIKVAMDAQARAVNLDQPSHISVKQVERQADPKSSGLECK